MAASPSVCYLRDIQTLFETGTAGSLSDRELLERFVKDRGALAEAAFEVLVLRHGPMVLRVCCNVLDDPTDAEDAFQATFLVLVRRCRSIRRLESLGSWLYGVAIRVAARARLDAARRRAAERRGGLRIMATIDPGEGNHGEFGPVIQQEVQHLPEKYRAVVVLCYWQGLNQEQAAARLGCPLGTVRSRLARARELLHRRLTRRGLAPLAGIVAVSFDRAATSASAEALCLSPVPFPLIQSTIHAAAQVAGGQATKQVVSTVVATLVQRFLWSTAMIKINGLVMGVVLFGLIGYGAGLAIGQAKGTRPIATPGASPTGELAANGRPVQDQPKTSDEPQPGDGNLKRPGDAQVYSNVPSTIIAIRPPGATVKKGEVICELDSTQLQDQLFDQKIIFETAKANFEDARLTRENAEIAVVEYQEGVFRMQDEEAAGDIKIAEAELAFAEDELNFYKKADKNREANGMGSDSSKLGIKRQELAVSRARFALEKAQTRQKVLRDYTHAAKIKKLKSDLERKRSNELAKKAIFELEAGKERKLEHWVDGCIIRAPWDGTLEFGPGTRVGEGSVVRERQLLFRIEPSPVPGPRAK